MAIDEVGEEQQFVHGQHSANALLVLVWALDRGILMRRRKVEVVGKFKLASATSHPKLSNKSAF